MGVRVVTITIANVFSVAVAIGVAGCAEGGFVGQTPAEPFRPDGGAAAESPPGDAAVPADPTVVDAGELDPAATPPDAEAPSDFVSCLEDADVEPIFVAPGGRSDNPGTADQPFGRIQDAVDAARAGDCIVVIAGTYHEIVNLSRSGTPDAWIRLEAFPGDDAIIDGRAGVDGPNGGLPQGDPVKTAPDGTYFVNGGLLNITGSYIQVSGLQVIRSHGRCVRIFPKDTDQREVILQHARVGFCHGHGVLVSQASGNSIEEITIRDIEMFGSGSYYPAVREANRGTDWNAAITVNGAHHVYILDSRVHNNWGEALIADSNDAGSHHVLIERNVFWDNFKAVDLHGLQNSVFRRNFVYRSIEDRISAEPMTHGAGLYVVSTEHTEFEDVNTRDILVANNLFVGLATGVAVMGAAARPEMSGVTIVHNTVVGCETGVRLRVTDKRDMLFRNNLMVHNDNNIELINGADGWTMDHNLYDQPPNCCTGDGDIVAAAALVDPDHPQNAGAGDPMWYRLTATSPAIDRAAATTPAIDNDLFGDARHEPADVGADEYDG